MRTENRHKLNRHAAAAVCFAAVLAFAALFMAGSTYASDSGIPDDDRLPVSNSIPHCLRKDLFTEETIDVSGIRVVEVQKDAQGNILTGEDGKPLTKDPEDPISFRIYNTTTQESECGGLVETVTDEEGRTWLPELSLKKDHDYIFYVEDENYRYPRGASYPAASKVYAQIRPGDNVTAPDGPGAYNYLTTSLRYNRIDQITVERRDSICDDPFEENRFEISDVTVRYNGGARAGISFRLVSDVETLDVKSGTGGSFSARLIEGVTYMVCIDSDRYSIDPFPIVVKDKTDYGTGEGIGCYNHSTCTRVNEITLYDKGETGFDGNERHTSIESRMKRSVVTGMSFKNLILIDRKLDDSVGALEGSDYEVISFTAVNPMRWEISKLTGLDFGVTWKDCAGRLVSHVYEMDGDGGLTEVGFSQTSGSEVSFTVGSLSLYPAVIEYDSDKSYADKMAEEQAARDRAAAEQAARERQARLDAWNGMPDGSLPVPKIAKPKAAKKSLTAKWKKLSKKQLKKAGSIKIEVQYSLDRSFPMEQTKSKYAGKKKASVKIKSLASKKTYYVRVRTYRESGGTKLVSKWSKVKKIKTK